jgi:hypothetical protein
MTSSPERMSPPLASSRPSLLERQGFSERRSVVGVEPAAGAEPDTGRILAGLGDYRRARAAFLDVLGCPSSNRDPLAELSERLVAALLGGTLPESRVQRGYDVIANGERIQVRYLANPSGRWVNEHVVDLRGDCDAYALVVVEALDPRHVLVFRRNGLGDVCRTLGKRHPHQERTLQLTHRNYQQIVTAPAHFKEFGADVFDLR